MFSRLGILNMAITAAGILILLVISYENSLSFETHAYLIQGWILIAFLVWGVSVFVLFVMLANKEKVQKGILIKNQSPLIFAVTVAVTLI